MVILPAIDLLEGRCVRLRQGDYAQRTEYGDDPLAVAMAYREAGATWVHIVDLDGARSGSPSPRHLRIVAEIARDSGLSVQFGGGIKSRAAAEDALGVGVRRFVIGSALVRDPDLAAWCFGRYPDQTVAGIDCKGGLVATHGWTQDSGRTAENLARSAADMGARRLVVTDIATDGMLVGPNLDLLLRVHRAAGLPVIASGGVSGLQDLRALSALDSAVEGVIVGKALYEGRFTLAEALAALGMV
ncbi:MAG: HisA/HisF-related TIM barrel protein [Fimbriimonadaceae bacterium]